MLGQRGSILMGRGPGHPALSWPGRPPAPCPETRSSLLGHGRGRVGSCPLGLGLLVRKAGIWGAQGPPRLMLGRWLRTLGHREAPPTPGGASEAS